MRESDPEYKEQEKIKTKERVADLRSDPEFKEQEKIKDKERKADLRKDPVKKAEEQERDRIRKKNNKIQKQIDSIFKLEENDKLFNRNYLYADRLCDLNKIQDWMHPIENDVKDVNGHNFRKLIDN